MKITDLATHPKPFVSVAEFIAYTEIPRRTMYHHIERGTLQAVKMGGTLKIPIAEARRFVSTPARPDLVPKASSKAVPEILCATGT